jgi:hypothetical protein
MVKSIKTSYNLYKAKLLRQKHMKDFSLNPLTLPLWWYTTGLGLAWRWAGRQARIGLQQTGLVLFFRHFREPLYGDYTKSGMAIGFFLRIVLLIFKLLAFGLRLILIAVMLLLFCLILPAIIIMIIYQLFPK